MRPPLIAVVVAVLGVVAVGVLALTSSTDRPAQQNGYTPADSSTQEIQTWTAAEAGTAFLDTYVDDDGRVTRPDHGDDTVSEGQAYGMLIAVGLGDEEAFARIWDWTATHLQRPDHLLSWRWEDGAVVDDEPASDADLDAARALALAADAFDDASYAEAATTLGEAVLDLETAQTEIGLVLTAGPWTTSSPWSVNPSYASPVATALLDAVSPDPRWAELDAGTRAVNLALLEQSPLVPDWAQVHEDGRVEAMPGAQGSGTDVRYSYDATRTLVRYAESCDAADHAVVTASLEALDGNDPLPAALDLGGGPLTQDQHPVGYVARAAARALDGDVDGATADLVASDELQQRTPSYFGGAWAALGRLMLETDALGGCAVLGDGAPVVNSAPEGFTGMVGQAPTEADASATGVGPSALADSDVVPVRVRIPAIEVDSPLEDLRRDDEGVLQPPVVPESAGWYSAGTVPGDRGPAVIAGHVDSGVAGAVFRDLDELEPGDLIEVEMSDGSVQVFAMDHSRLFGQGRDEFPTAAVYGPVPNSQLRLITCHTYDPDRSAYVENLVVYATAQN